MGYGFRCKSVLFEEKGEGHEFYSCAELQTLGRSLAPEAGFSRGDFR